MEPNCEIEKLRAEVAELKKQVLELRRFLHIESDTDNPERKTLHITCSGISLYSPADTEHKAQGILMATREGPVLSLWGKNETARVVMEVAGDEGNVRVLDKNLKLIVNMGRDDEGRPHVGVLHAGQPRALIKALPAMGAVSAVYDDGATRAFLSSHFDHGEMFVVGGDMQAAVKLSADGASGGGYVAVNHANGQPALYLGSTYQGGGIVTKDSRGKVLGTWPAGE